MIKLCWFINESFNYWWCWLYRSNTVYHLLDKGFEEEVIDDFSTGSINLILKI